jgi:DNA mismatch repair protein MutS
VTFHSILFERPEHQSDADGREAPACFADLHLDQVVESITASRKDYDLKPFFYAPLPDVGAVNYRQEVFRDLEGEAAWACVRSFAEKMRSMRQHLAQADKLYYKYQKESWFLDAAAIYTDAVKGLWQDLSRAAPASRGLLAFHEFLSRYIESPAFAGLVAETAAVRSALAGVAYCLHINGNRIKVTKYDGEANYAAEVEETFQKFKRGAAKDYRVKFLDSAAMNHVEAGVLDLVAQWYPDVFSSLDAYCERHRDYLDQTIAGFDREIQFYVAYLEYVRQFTPAGLRFCYPHVSDRSKEISACDAFDVALANRLLPERAPVVCNDFYLTDPERVFVVTGPNQGGKTTFARTFGQLHYLASLGCLVPGRTARLFLFDHLFTHFEREEDLSNLRGKLQDDLVRIHDTMARATPDSIVIMNEIFTSTTFRDALFLSKNILERLIRLDLLCVCVTFVDELAFLGETVVSMVSTVVPDNPTLRTYKIIRRPADGRAYAVAIAEKYGLTHERLRERLAR